MIKKTILSAIIALFLFAAPAAQAQQSFDRQPNNNGSAGPPPPPGSHGSEDNFEAQSPIGGGLLILLTLGLAYGGKKVYDARKRLT